MASKLLIIILIFIATMMVRCSSATELDDYVNQPDPSYRWTLHPTLIENANYTVYNIHLVSQTWLSPALASISLWQHWLSVCIPKNIDTSLETAMLFIQGSGNTPNGGLPNPPTGLDANSGSVCSQSRGVVARISQVPNQPIRFYNDPEQLDRVEDGLIAWTWSVFLHNSSESRWIARLPMTKAAVRAMDTVQAFTKSHGLNIQTFVVTGMSKRGWTTWTTGAVDKRVIGIAPMVLPLGHLSPTIDAMYRVYGNWSWVLKDYVDARIFEHLNTPNWWKLISIIDPAVYYDRWHNIAKYPIAGTSDQFFLPDSTRFWWNELPGPKLQFMAAGAEHSLQAAPLADVSVSLSTFFNLVARRLPLPTWEWNIVYSNASAASITATAKGQQPRFVYLQFANTLSTTLRDFRAHTCSKNRPECLNPIVWNKVSLAETSPGSRTWTATMGSPPAGWTAFLLEAWFDNAFQNPGITNRYIRATTDVNVVPDRYPYDRCEVTNTCQPPLPWDP